MLLLEFLDKYIGLEESDWLLRMKTPKGQKNWQAGSPKSINGVFQSTMMFSLGECSSQNVYSLECSPSPNFELNLENETTLSTTTDQDVCEKGRVPTIVLIPLGCRTHY